MSEQTELSKQQKKSKETKARIFRAAKQILKKKGFRMVVFIIILRQKTTFFRII